MSISCKLHRPFELVNRIIGFFADYLAFQRRECLVVRSKARVDARILLKVRIDIFVSILDLQVCFSVQVFGFDIANAFG